MIITMYSDLLSSLQLLRDLFPELPLCSSFLTSFFFSANVITALAFLEIFQELL